MITRATACTLEDARDAADAAAAAFPAWSGAEAGVRAGLLTRAAHLLAARVEQFVQVACKEVGATPEWIRFNTDIACDTLRHAATLAPAAGTAPYEAGNPAVGYLQVRRPAGVVLGIAPWNAPVTLAVRAIAAPLALGNTVILKGSELCPRTHEMVAQAFLDAGAAEGVVNFVTHAPEEAHAVVAALIGHPVVRRVNFTGSTRVGREVALMAAQHLKPCLLELSGKAAMIVLADADIDAAAEAAIHGAFFNQGQICMSTDRVVVEEAVADRFVAALKTRAEALRVADPAAGPGPLGALIAADAALRVRGLVDDALRKGARLVCGGEIYNRLMQPTVLDHVSFGMRIYSEETFGPALSVIRVGDADEAVSVANDTDFGLAAAIFSADEARAARLAARVEVGVVHINGSTVYDDPYLPFGGVKASGYGRFGGQSGIAEFTDLQFITRRPARAPCASDQKTSQTTTEEE